MLDILLSLIYIYIYFFIVDCTQTQGPLGAHHVRVHKVQCAGLFYSNLNPSVISYIYIYIVNGFYQFQNLLFNLLYFILI